MMFRPAMPWKSAGLWVTRSMPWARAVAAIQASATAIGCAPLGAKLGEAPAEIV
jgi:hypothetical protein